MLLSREEKVRYKIRDPKFFIIMAILGVIIALKSSEIREYKTRKCKCECNKQAG